MTTSISRRAGLASMAAATATATAALAAAPGPADARCRKKPVTVMPAITQATVPEARLSPLAGRGGYGTWSIVASGAGMAFAFDAAGEPAAVPISAMVPAPGTTLVLHLTAFNNDEDACSFVVDGGAFDPETGVVTWTGVMEGEAAAGPRGYGASHDLRDAHIAVFPPVG